MEEFLQDLENFNWQSTESCSEKEYKHLQQYLTKENAQNNYAVNFLSLKWLMGTSTNFVTNIVNKSYDEFMEMKKHIYLLIGPILFDRLELTRMNVMKIGLFFFLFNMSE